MAGRGQPKQGQGGMPTCGVFGVRRACGPISGLTTRPASLEPNLTGTRMRKEHPGRLAAVNPS